MIDAQGLGRRTLLTNAVTLASGLAVATAIPSKVAASPARTVAPDKIVTVAFLLDNSATMIDFAGPWEVFQDSGTSKSRFNLITVAPKKELIMATGGMLIMPDYALDDAPPAKVIVIPAQTGGRSGEGVESRVNWIRSRAESADFVVSVCTGAFLLARTGLLDGQSATTHHQFVDEFAKAFPKVKPLRNQRFVDNGKFITSGGLSSGIEAALHIVERYHGPAERARVANYMEYVPGTWREGLSG